MALGGQTRGLILASKMAGWDPTKIEGGESIANFDKDPVAPRNDTTGTLPQGIPDSFPDDTESPLGQRISFNAPDFGRERPRHTTGADPTPGR